MNKKSLCTFFLLCAAFSLCAREVSVLEFGAVGDGVHDDTAAIQKALDAARGTDGLKGGRDRSVFTLYFPTQKNGFYKITDSLRIDGTHGMVIRGDGAQTWRDPQNATIRWYGESSKPIFWVKGGAGTPSNPNFFITIRDLTIAGYRERIDFTAAQPPANIALSAIHFGTLADEKPENTLCRMAIVENVHISNCRFGIWSGNPHGLNTDHATVNISNCFIGHCTQAGICWGTGNAIANVFGCHIGSSGKWGKFYEKDAYSDPIGAHIHVYGGYVDVVSYTSGCSEKTMPSDAEMYQTAGRIAVTNAWSDTAGYFLYQAYVSQNEGGYHNTMLTGIRHYNGCQFFKDKTPNSLRLIAPGMVVSGCLFYGNIVVDSGLNGRPVFSGVNFIRKDAGFIGTGVEQQRSLVVLGNAGNSGQIMVGGANAGVPLKHKGTQTPQFLGMGDNPVLFQALDASAEGTGIEFRTATKDANGNNQLLINAYYSENGVTPLQAEKMVWKLTFGGGASAFTVTGFDPNGSTAEISDDQFKSFGGFICAPVKGAREQVTFRPPVRESAPDFQSGNYWEGSIYYDSNAKKLKLNIGGRNWVDLN
ncbi:MAG: hypothetical protein GX927_05025 [Lentisphaerae bacterium]|jgi:hypothetical protein|nr:hypothetical protein [Lentisphaerota bacterium]